MYLITTYPVIDAIVSHPKTCAVVYVKTVEDMRALVEAYLKEYHWDEEILSFQVSLDDSKIKFKTKDIDIGHEQTRTWHLLPIERYTK